MKVLFLLFYTLLADDKTYYTIPQKEYSSKDRFSHIGVAYLFSWGIYPFVLKDEIKKNGSWENYKKNFGRITFDRDEPYWNWMVHPFSGSMLYLYYRTLGYSQTQALGLSFISSTLFELTIEIYTEPASVQDIYQTPVIGAVVGMGMEYISLRLLNSGTLLGKIFGHIVNPFTLFWFYDGHITPSFDGKKAGVIFTSDF